MFNDLQIDTVQPLQSRCVFILVVLFEEWVDRVEIGRLIKLKLVLKLFIFLDNFLPHFAIIWRFLLFLTFFFKVAALLIEKNVGICARCKISHGISMFVSAKGFSSDIILVEHCNWLVVKLIPSVVIFDEGVIVASLWSTWVDHHSF